MRTVADRSVCDMSDGLLILTLFVEMHCHIGG